ncbi:MAG: hypothetical protein Q9M29_06005 [Mariprofundaceae bacterium]|nr:hypothetical protein [Mariprofundaceae bacterium]
MQRRVSTAAKTVGWVMLPAVAFMLAVFVAHGCELAAATVAQADVPAQQEGSRDVATVSAPLDMDMLVERLKQTRAIGFFTKLAIRNDVMDLIVLIDNYRKKSVLESKLNDVRARFEGLFLKIVALLENDPDLSRDIYLAREKIWKSLLEVKA